MNPYCLKKAFNLNLCCSMDPINTFVEIYGGKIIRD